MGVATAGGVDFLNLSTSHDWFLFGFLSSQGWAERLPVALTPLTGGVALADDSPISHIFTAGVDPMFICGKKIAA